MMSMNIRALISRHLTYHVYTRINVYDQIRAIIKQKVSDSCQNSLSSTLIK